MLLEVLFVLRSWNPLQVWLSVQVCINSWSVKRGTFWLFVKKCDIGAYGIFFDILSYSVFVLDTKLLNEWRV